MTGYDLSDPALLFRPDVIEEPAPLYRYLHDHAPVWEVPGTSTFVVSTAALVAEAVARPDDFSSNLVSLLHRGDDGSPTTFDMAPLGDATHVLATADPPVHTAHRKLVQPHLAPVRMDRLAAGIAAMADHLLDPLLSDGRGDIVSALCDPLPMAVICRVVGLPEEDADVLVPLLLATNRVLAGVTTTAGMQQATEAALGVVGYLVPHLQAALGEEVADGTLLAVLATSLAQEEMTFEEAVGILVQLLGAGTETTTSLLGRAVLVLADDEAVQDRLRAEPERIPAFLEEVLRFDGPFRFHYRFARHATALGGVPIPAGSRVMLLWAAANLDEAMVPLPHRFDLDRSTPRAHFAFGRGIHFCIGAPLARLEGRIAIGRLLHRTSAFRRNADDAPRYFDDIFIRRLARLELTVEADGAGDRPRP